VAGAGGDRWVEVSPSQFTHESEGLALVRKILPDEAPFRAWSNFEFRDSHGKWHEVDLLLLGRGQLHLIELKYYSGALRGDDHRWLRDGKRAEDSPLKLARRKAQYFASKLTDELRSWANEKHLPIPDHRAIVPFVQESVFLHHDRFTSQLSQASAIGLYGLDGQQATSRLPGISELVLAQPHRQAIGSNQEAILVDLMARIGLVQRRERQAGSWVIQEQAIAEGEGWQDWLASHQVAQQQQARIRFQVTPAGAPDSERTRVRKLAEHEFGVMSRLQHDGLLRPRDLVESDLGVGLVYDYDEAWQRLDLWLAGQPAGVPLTAQLSIVRQVGEAVQYAHGNKVVHRALSPRAVWVKSVPGTHGDVKVRVGDWQGSGVIDPASLTRTSMPGVTSLHGALSPATATSAQDSGHNGAPQVADPDTWLAEAFQAPEGQWSATADRVRLDVFGLGALAFYVIAGKPAATTRQALRTRLQEQSGLDLSVELPQIGSTLRSLVLKATHPAPTQRTGDISTILAQVARVERETSSEDTTTGDPLEATPGTVLDGRFRLQRRLGQGSTAAGLLVTDLHAPDGTPDRVLKVALHDDAAKRLVDEAEVLRGIDSPRLVTILEGPLTVGGRAALLLESAGDETLTEALRARDRLSLDLLQRYGTELLEALVALDKAGVDHRDIKPSNLGVREGRGDRTKHLVLFDFSLTRAAASATSAGTPPYLDPFLTGDRDRYDSAAERYAAAVVLFEMATGRAPTYGDGQSDPAAITDEAAIEPAMFDPTLAPHLTAFFTAALSRDVAARHHTAEEMRSTWTSIFATDATTEPDDAADDLAAAATLATPLKDSGLTARALSALEPYDVDTVSDLLTIDPVRLSRLPGVANSTRLQISRRIKQWRERLGDDVTARPRHTDTTRLTIEDAADLLLQSAATSRSRNRGAMVSLVLGIGTDLDAFATHGQLAANLPEPVTPARATQLMTTLQETWAADTDARALLDRLVDAFTHEMVELGSVATVSEAVVTIHNALGADPRAHGRDDRTAAGLLRLTVDRMKALERADASPMPVVTRRRDGQVVLIAREPYLLDVAESLGREANAIVTSTPDPTTALVPAARAKARLSATLDAFPDQQLPMAIRESDRIVRLGAAMSTRAAVTGAGDLHHRDLTQTAALALTFKGFGGAQHLTPDEIRSRVGVRFPAVPQLPQRPRLDELVREAGLELIFDDVLRVYRNPQRSSDTTGLESRPPTRHSAATSPSASLGDIGPRLDQSIASRSSLALGVEATRTSRLVVGLERRYAAHTVDVTSVLIESLRSQAAAVGLPWETVRAADAEPITSRGRQGLGAMVRASWDDVIAAVEAALDDTSDGPVVLTEASPLARYDNMALLARWSDLSVARPRAVWLVVPQLAGNTGARLDGRPVPVTAPSQFVAVDHEWVDGLAATSVGAHGKEEV